MPFNNHFWQIDFLPEKLNHWHQMKLKSPGNALNLVVRNIKELLSLKIQSTVLILY